MRILWKKALAVPPQPRTLPANPAIPATSQIPDPITPVEKQYFEAAKFINSLANQLDAPNFFIPPSHQTVMKDFITKMKNMFFIIPQADMTRPEWQDRIKDGAIVVSKESLENTTPKQQPNKTFLTSSPPR